MGYKAIDLFSGAGGLHIGFERAGYEIELCIDNDSLVEKTHRRNFPNIPMINRDIRKIPSSEIKTYIPDGTVDVIIGGPPVRAFQPSENAFLLILKLERGRIPEMSWC